MKATKKQTVTAPFTNKRLPKIHPVPIQEKTALQLLEDVLGVLSNRKELLAAIIKKFPGAHDGHKTFLQHQQQTKKFMTPLLKRLSQYGDAAAGPDPHNDYNRYWKTGLQKWDAISRPRLIHFWLTLETILQDYYRLLLAQQDNLPPGLSQLLEAQLAQLETKDTHNTKNTTQIR